MQITFPRKSLVWLQRRRQATDSCPHRRLVSGWIVLVGLLVLLVSGTAAQEARFNLLDRWLIWSDPGTMVIRQVTNEAIAHLDRRQADLARLHTREDWLARQRHVRATLERVIGIISRPSPLNPRVTGIVRKDGYRIEKVIFESLPQLYVTACLLVPDGITGRAPTILYTAGSSIRTFRGEQYQQHILNLVKKGYIVFAIDPIGQGERIHFHDAATGKSTVNEFNHAAHQCFLIGTSYAKYYVRDAMRALDYLQTRPEVDPNRIGMGGLSWGGWQCTIVSALDHRVAAAASAAGCNVGMRRWLQSMGPTSAGQHYPGFLTAGLDHGDFFALMAPRAFLRMSTINDYKVIQGARETYAEYRRAFEALGALDKLDATEDDAGHGYTPANNEAAYRFYGKHLAHPAPATFEPMAMMTDDDTKITPTGQVVTSFKDAASAFDFNRAEAIPLLERLDEARKTGATHLASVRSAAQRLAGVRVPGDGAAPVFTGRHLRAGFAVETYVLEGGKDYVIPLLLFVPEGSGRRRAVIYLHPDGKSAAAKPGGEVEQLARQGYLVAVPDVAGTGETRNKRGDFGALQYIGLMMERSVVGMQAGDVMRVRAFLDSHPQHRTDRIGAVAVGSMGSMLIHAAALDPGLAGVTLSDASLSYRSVVMNKLYQMNISEMVAGALTAYDLPDLMACMAPRRLALIGGRSHMLEPADSSMVKEELAFPLSVYGRTGAGTNFRLMPSGTRLTTTVDWMLE